MRVRARFEGGAFRPLDPVDLGDGVEVFLQVEAADAHAWREQVSFRCLRVGTLTATLSWYLPGPGSGAPPVHSCQVLLCPREPLPEAGLEKALAGASVLATVFPPRDALHADVSVALSPDPQARRLHFGLKFLDGDARAHPVALLAVPIPGIRVVLEDRVDGAPAAWEAEGTWGRLPSGEWTDSPHGDYANNANDSLTSPPFSLEGLLDPALVFEERHNIEEFSDRCYLEVRPDGEEWVALDRFSGVRDWGVRRYDLSAFGGRMMRLRFRLVTDRSITRDGIYFRNLRVAGHPRPG